MHRGALYHQSYAGSRWAWVIAIAFAAVAALSFAVDMAVSMSASSPGKIGAHLKPIVR